MTGHLNRGRLAVQMGGPWRLYQRTELPGWQMLGTVQRGMEIGALARSPAGVYAQVNQGVIKALDQRKALTAIESSTRTLKMELFIYSLENNKHVATITGGSNAACESKAEEEYGSNDFGWTYSPAFGASDGLIENGAAA